MAGPGGAALDELSRNFTYGALGAGNGSLSGAWYRRNQVRAAARRPVRTRAGPLLRARPPALRSTPAAHVDPPGRCLHTLTSLPLEGESGRGRGTLGFHPWAPVTPRHRQWGAQICGSGLRTSFLGRWVQNNPPLQPESASPPGRILGVWGESSCIRIPPVNNRDSPFSEAGGSGRAPAQVPRVRAPRVRSQSPCSSPCPRGSTLLAGAPAWLSPSFSPAL